MGRLRRFRFWTTSASNFGVSFSSTLFLLRLIIRYVAWEGRCKIQGQTFNIATKL